MVENDYYEHGYYFLSCYRRLLLFIYTALLQTREGRIKILAPCIVIEMSFAEKPHFKTEIVSIALWKLKAIISCLK